MFYCYVQQTHRNARGSYCNCHCDGSFRRILHTIPICANVLHVQLFPSTTKVAPSCPIRTPIVYNVREYTPIVVHHHCDERHGEINVEIDDWWIHRKIESQARSSDFFWILLLWRKTVDPRWSTTIIHFILVKVIPGSNGVLWIAYHKIGAMIYRLLFKKGGNLTCLRCRLLNKQW